MATRGLQGTVTRDGTVMEVLQPIKRRHTVADVSLDTTALKGLQDLSSVMAGISVTSRVLINQPETVQQDISAVFKLAVLILPTVLQEMFVPVDGTVPRELGIQSRVHRVLTTMLHKLPTRVHANCVPGESIAMVPGWKPPMGPVHLVGTALLDNHLVHHHHTLVLLDTAVWKVLIVQKDALQDTIRTNR